LTFLAILKRNQSRKLFNEFIAEGNKVIDLGCGNGFLLYLLLQCNQNTFIPYGIDINAKRIFWAKKLLPDFSSNFFVIIYFKVSGVIDFLMSLLHH
jgi:ubiquinone/menaquinone biosynthesis C-methylase UbiE